MREDVCGESAAMSRSAARDIEKEYYFSLGHESKCKGDKTIRIPTYPNSPKVVETQVCAECYPILWAHMDVDACPVPAQMLYDNA
jgi:hypothetical protein